MTRVLIADDDSNMRAILQIALQAQGYQVETAPNGKLAVQMHERHPADVLITDLFMPEQDGFETLQQFRARSPQMPIIAISGWKPNQLTDQLNVAVHAGATRVLRKPFEMHELLEVLRSLLAR